MSQENVAFDAGIDVSTYSRLERGACGERWANPRLRTLLRLLCALKVTDSELRELAGVLLVSCSEEGGDRSSAAA